MGRGKNLVDRAIAAAGDDAINFSSASFSDGFAGQSCSVAGFPSDPHFHNLTVLAQCALTAVLSRLSLAALPCRIMRMGATPFDPGVQETHQVQSLGSNLLLRLIIRQVSRDGHLDLKLEWA